MEIIIRKNIYIFGIYHFLNVILCATFILLNILKGKLKKRIYIIFYMLFLYNLIIINLINAIRGNYLRLISFSGCFWAVKILNISIPIDSYKIHMYILFSIYFYLSNLYLSHILIINKNYLYYCNEMRVKSLLSLRFQKDWFL